MQNEFVGESLTTSLETMLLPIISKLLPFPDWSSPMFVCAVVPAVVVAVPVPSKVR